jgi:hypothetical protein
MAYLKDSVFIASSPEKVHAFAAEPKDWSTWFVGLGAPESIEGDNAPGTTVKHSYMMMGMHFPITTTVTEHSAAADGSWHWKSENTGSFAGWQAWDYKPEDGGTRVQVEMEYEVPGSVFGKVADRLFVEKNQERALRHTLENLKHLTES